MSRFANSLVTAAAALSLCSISTAAIGATPAPSPASHSDQWLMLSAMTTSSATTSKAAAAQGESGMGFPPWPVLGVILATLATAVFILASDDDGDVDLGLPVSPS
jgi:hypothetical protein